MKTVSKVLAVAAVFSPGLAFAATSNAVGEACCALAVCCGLACC
jgi:hypothetical protein